MNIITNITSDKVLHIEVDTGCSEVYVEQINIYTCESLQSNEAIYTEKVGDKESYVSLHLNENCINAWKEAHFANRTTIYKNIDLLNDLVIIEVKLTSTLQHQINCPCDQNQTCYITATYYKCRIYDRIMNALQSVEDDCVNLNNSQFVDEVLKKKMIDTCIEAKQLRKACKLWSRFYSTGKTVSKGGCGCGS